jgi:hypothetical protein
MFNLYICLSLDNLTVFIAVVKTSSALQIKYILINSFT